MESKSRRCSADPTSSHPGIVALGEIRLIPYAIRIKSSVATQGVSFLARGGRVLSPPFIEPLLVLQFPRISYTGSPISEKAPSRKVSEYSLAAVPIVLLELPCVGDAGNTEWRSGTLVFHLFAIREDHNRERLCPLRLLLDDGRNYVMTVRCLYREILFRDAARYREEAVTDNAGPRNSQG